MATYESMAAFEAQIGKLMADLRGPARKHITNAAAVRATPLARRAASADLGGDPKFSGWAPRLSVSVKQMNNGSAVIHPTKTSAGPWTVAEQGRHSDGGVGRFQGPGVNMRTGRTSRRKDGTVSTANRRRKSVRWNGMTQGKSTASDAVEMFEAKIPGYMAEEVEKIIRKHLGG